MITIPSNGPLRPTIENDHRGFALHPSSDTRIRPRLKGESRPDPPTIGAMHAPEDSAPSRSPPSSATDGGEKTKALTSTIGPSWGPDEGDVVNDRSEKSTDEQFFAEHPEQSVRWRVRIAGEFDIEPPDSTDSREHEGRSS